MHPYPFDGHVLAGVPAGQNALRDDRRRAATLVYARLVASMASEGIDEHFVDGHELPPEMARKIPAGMVGARCRPTRP